MIALESLQVTTFIQSVDGILYSLDFATHNALQTLSTNSLIVINKGLTYLLFLNDVDRDFSELIGKHNLSGFMFNSFVNFSLFQYRFPNNSECSS